MTYRTAAEAAFREIVSVDRDLDIYRMADRARFVNLYVTNP